ncbi:MFS transporter [Priestia filamentosa]|uniref:MFS transporter n=1 Tax=Priestia filamentosa TaxID=1402861 RepID=UPI000E74AFAD|nr:MFS transporter [Priestia filamentosa]RJS63145.1 MFS transporter [Priestia filamentosa]
MFKRFHYAWVIFACTCIISLVGFGLVINTAGLFFAPISESFGIGLGEVTLMQTFQGIAAMVTFLFAGKLMEKTNIKVLLTVSYSVIGLGLISLSMADSIIPFYIVKTLIGIAQPFAIVLSIPVLLGNWFEKKLGTVMGIALGISAIGGSIFNPIISMVITNANWRVGFIVSGAIVLILTLPITLFLIKYKPEKGQQPYGYETTKNVENKGVDFGFSIKQALKTPLFYLLAFADTALNFISGFVQNISGHIVNVGHSLTTGASVISAVMLGAAIGKILIGYLLDKFNQSFIIIMYMIFGSLGWGGLVITTSGTALVASGFLLGLGQAMLLVSLPYFTRKTFGPKSYSSIYSIITMFGAFSGAISISIGGAIFDATQSYAYPIWANVGLYIVSAIAIIMTINITRKAINRRELNNESGYSNKKLS